MIALSKKSPGQNKLILPRRFPYSVFFLLNAPDAYLLFIGGITSNQRKNVTPLAKVYYNINFAAKSLEVTGGGVVTLF